MSTEATAALRRQYFASLYKNGVREANRKRWQQENGLPLGTQDFTIDDYVRAIHVLESLRPEPVEEGQ